MNVYLKFKEKMANGIKEYAQKRDFKKTEEPPGCIKAAINGELIFVVQNISSHLHYDFRLEVDGVLKVGLFPKGLLSNPAE